MKVNLNLKPIHDMNTKSQNPTQSNPARRQVFKRGLDVDLQYVVTAIQCDRGAIALAQKFTRPWLLDWVSKQVAAGHTVHTVYEACGFGYTLHDNLVTAGAQSIVTTPMRLNPERRRKNDRLDARELCVRLSRHLEGHAHELKPIRIPARAEQQRASWVANVSSGSANCDDWKITDEHCASSWSMRRCPRAGRGRPSGNRSHPNARTSCADNWSRSWRRSARAKRRWTA